MYVFLVSQTFRLTASLMTNKDNFRHYINCNKTSSLLFFRRNILVVCTIIVSKLAVTVFTRLNFRSLRPNWLNFFQFQKILSVTEKTTSSWLIRACLVFIRGRHDRDRGGHPARHREAEWWRRTTLLLWDYLSREKFPVAGRVGRRAHSLGESYTGSPLGLYFFIPAHKRQFCFAFVLGLWFA